MEAQPSGGVRGLDGAGLLGTEVERRRGVLWSLTHRAPCCGHSSGMVARATCVIRNTLVATSKKEKRKLSNIFY